MRRGADLSCRRSFRIDHVEKYLAGVSRSKSFDPRHEELRFAQRQVVVVDEVAVAGNRRPGRHVATQHGRSHRPALQPRLLVGRRAETTAPSSTWHITHRWSRIRTISRSNSTVVVERPMRLHRAAATTTTQRNAQSQEPRAESPLAHRSRTSNVVANVWTRVVAAELRPGAIAAGLRHQAVEDHLGTAAQLLEIGTRRDQELRHVFVVVRRRERCRASASGRTRPCPRS